MNPDVPCPTVYSNLLPHFPQNLISALRWAVPHLVQCLVVSETFSKASCLHTFTGAYGNMQQSMLEARCGRFLSPAAHVPAMAGGLGIATTAAPVVTPVEAGAPW